LPIETSGDGAVNVQSRVQMMLFKARLAAKAEVDEVCLKHGVTIDQVREYARRSPRFRHTFHRSPHAHLGCTTAKFVAAHRFYEKSGFAAIPKTDLPAAFPVMSVDTKFYVRNIATGDAQPSRDS
jgi:hypothetical protein